MIKQILFILLMLLLPIGYYFGINTFGNMILERGFVREVEGVEFSDWVINVGDGSFEFVPYFIGDDDYLDIDVKKEIETFTYQGQNIMQFIFSVDSKDKDKIKEIGLRITNLNSFIVRACLSLTGAVENQV